MRNDVQVGATVRDVQARTKIMRPIGRPIGRLRKSISCEPFPAALQGLWSRSPQCGPVWIASHGWTKRFERLERQKTLKSFSTIHSTGGKLDQNP